MEKIISALCQMAVSLKNDEFPDDAYRGIAYLGYDLAVESYDEITDKIKGIC